MKKLLTVLMMSSTLFLSAQALKADDHGEHHKAPLSAEKMLNKMDKHLNLTDEQKANILPILEADMAQSKAMREERREKIASFLTDEQKQMMAHKGDKAKRCKDD